MASIAQFQYALELARSGHFAVAAKRCFVTQPTLSMQLKKLEQEYGVQLFDRTKKPVTPTEAGRPLLAQFQSVLNEYEKIGQMVQVGRGEPAGRYRLAVIPTLAPTLLPQIVTGFRTRYPKVQLVLSEQTTDQITEGIISGALDGGLLATPLKISRTREYHLFLEPLYVFHGRELAVQESAPGFVRLDDLPREALITLSSGHCLRTQTIDLCQVTGAEQRHLRLEAWGLQTVINLVKEGPYFTVLPALALASLDQKVRDTQVKRLDGPLAVRQVSLLTHQSELKHQIDQVLVDLLPPPKEALSLDAPGVRILEPTKP